MAKEKSADKEERRREKAAKKEKRSEKDGVHKSSNSKKDKKSSTTEVAPSVPQVKAEEQDATVALLDNLENVAPGSVAVKENGDVTVKVKTAPLIGALVPFANPLADEKVGKKVLKSVKKGMRGSSPLPCSPPSLRTRPGIPSNFHHS